MTAIQASERGSALIEASVTLALSTTLAISGLTILYLGFARVWVDRNVYEALICLATDSPVRACEDALRTTIQGALPFGGIARVQMNRVRERVQVEIEFRIQNHIVLKRKDSKALPIQGRPSRNRRITL